MVQVSIGDIRYLLVNRLGFVEYVKPNGEVCWRQTLPKYSSVIHVCSGLRSDNTSLSFPTVGIRVYLLDCFDSPKLGVRRVRRTPHYLSNIWKTINELYKIVLEQERSKKF